MEQKYWKTPYHWFEDYVKTLSKNELKAALLNFAELAGFEVIQDIYESDMAKDGYFEWSDRVR